MTDVGSGTGALLAPLAPLIQPGGSIVGIDLSAVMVREATRRASELRAPIQFQEGDAQHLDFPDASFDRAMDVERRSRQSGLLVAFTGFRAVGRCQP